MSRNEQLLLKAIYEYAQARIDLSWLGGSDPKAWPFIRKRHRKAYREMRIAIRRLVKHKESTNVS